MAVAGGAAQGPDGNSLCLFQAGKNRKNPLWRVAE